MTYLWWLQCYKVSPPWLRADPTFPPQATPPAGKPHPPPATTPVVVVVVVVVVRDQPRGSAGKGSREKVTFKTQFWILGSLAVEMNGEMSSSANLWFYVPTLMITTNFEGV